MQKVNILALLTLLGYWRINEKTMIEAILTQI